jgi:electron transport complex protein RnfG
MSAVEQAQQLPATPSVAMIRVLMLVAMLSGFFVVLAYEWSKPYIEENQRIATEQAVFQVVAGATARRDFRVTANAVRPAAETGEGELVYAAYGADGRLLGVALPAAAQGYADMIRLLYGFDPACQCIRGIKVLKMTETPGLGDKIITDAAFRKNFEALDARLNPAGDGLANAIVTVKHGSKTEPWQIDAISGATVSSKAVGKALNDSAQRLLPAIVRNLAVLEQGAPAGQGGEASGGTTQ